MTEKDTKTEVAPDVATNKGKTTKTVTHDVSDQFAEETPKRQQGFGTSAPPKKGGRVGWSL